MSETNTPTPEAPPTTPVDTAPAPAAAPVPPPAPVPDPAPAPEDKHGLLARIEDELASLERHVGARGKVIMDDLRAAFLKLRSHL